MHHGHENAEKDHDAGNGKNSSVNVHWITSPGFTWKLQALGSRSFLPKIYCLLILHFFLGQGALKKPVGPDLVIDDNGNEHHHHKQHDFQGQGT